jgi:hypothetical protein
VVSFTRLLAVVEKVEFVVAKSFCTFCEFLRLFSQLLIERSMKQYSVLFAAVLAADLLAVGLASFVGPVLGFASGYIVL